jgi:hypothetical protein
MGRRWRRWMRGGLGPWPLFLDRGLRSVACPATCPGDLSALFSGRPCEETVRGWLRQVGRWKAPRAEEGGGLTVSGWSADALGKGDSEL